MQEKIQAIVLEVTRSGERSSVASLYTRSRGRVPFIVPAPSASRRGRAPLMPLQIVEADIRFVAGKEIQRLGRVSPVRVWHSLYFNPVKSAIVLFLQDFLRRFLRESGPDASLWDYVALSLRVLDDITASQASSFHIAFLMGLLPLAGIAPDFGSYRSGFRFDMRAGVFVSAEPLHSDFLCAEEAAVACRLGRISFANMSRFSFTGEERRRVVRTLLRYYAIHLPGLDSLRSMGVLGAVFH